jgi:hypothetical protein
MLTSKNALADCVRVFPAFQSYWETEGNLFREDNGAYTVCGVYMHLTWFVREHWQSFQESDWCAFAALVADHVGMVQNPDGEIGACLIENLEGEAFSHLVAKHFDYKLLQRYQFAN